MRFDFDLLPDDTRPYFRDVFDHVIRINEMVDNLRELLTTAFEVNLSLVSIEENQEMKRLAEFSVAQNREMRPLALAVMAASSGALFVGFKRSGWL